MRLNLHAIPLPSPQGATSLSGNSHTACTQLTRHLLWYHFEAKGGMHHTSKKALVGIHSSRCRRLQRCAHHHHHCFAFILVGPHSMRGRVMRDSLPHSDIPPAHDTEQQPPVPASNAPSSPPDAFEISLNWLATCMTVSKED